MNTRLGIYDPKLLRKVVFNISYSPYGGYNIQTVFCDVEDGPLYKDNVIVSLTIKANNLLLLLIFNWGRN